MWLMAYQNKRYKKYSECDSNYVQLRALKNVFSRGETNQIKL